MGKKKNTIGKIVNQKPQGIKVPGNQYSNDEENANKVASLNRSPAATSPSGSSQTAPPPTASVNSGGAPPKASNRSTPSVNPYAKILSIGQTDLPPPPPDPVFVLRGASSSITCVQFLAPPLRMSDLTPSQTEVLKASYRNPDAAEDAIYELGRQCGGSSSTPLLKLPPPGFLSPTKHIAAGLQNGQILIWDLKSKQQVACWQAHPPESAVQAIKSLSPTRLVSLGRRDCLKLWTLESANHDVAHLSPSSTKDKSPASPHAKGSASGKSGTAGGSSSSSESSDGASSSSPKEKSGSGSPLADSGKEGASSKEKAPSSKLGSLTAVCKTHISLGEYLGFSVCDVFRHVNCIVAAIPGGPQDAVSVWSVDNRIKICQLRVNETSKVGSVMQLKWIEKKGKVSLLVAYESGDLCLWDWSNRDLHSVACIQGTPVSLEYDQSLGSGVLGTTEDGIFIFSISSNLVLTIIKEITVTNEGIGCCISRPDGKIYATGGWDNCIRIFSWQKHKALAVLNYHGNSVSCLHYSASRVASCDVAGLSNAGVGPISAGAEHVLAAGSLDGSVSLWKIY